MPHVLTRRRALIDRVPIIDWPGSNFPNRPETFSRSGSAYYVDPLGVLQSVGTNERRRTHYVTDNAGIVRQTGLLEVAATNRVWPCRDLTNANWVPTNITPLKDQTGVDGAANSASSIEATGANGTILSSDTLASSSRITSAYVKRLVGTGTVEMTTNNGTNWDAVTVTSSWTRVSITARTVTNPVVGFRIVTSGDKIAVDFVQGETGPVVTSPILTTTAAATRAVDITTLPFPSQIREMSGMVEFVEGGTISLGANNRIFGIGSGSGSGILGRVLTSSGRYQIIVVNTAGSNLQATLAAAGVLGDYIRIWWRFWYEGANAYAQIRQSINGGAWSSVVTSSTINLDWSAWNGTNYEINCRSDGAVSGINAHIRHRVYPGYVPAEAF